MTYDEALAAIRGYAREVESQHKLIPPGGPVGPLLAVLVEKRILTIAEVCRLIDDSVVT
jgi:hypothetical protein